MPALHQRGVDLLLNVFHAQEHFDSLSSAEVWAILKETGIVLAQLLERDIPEDRRSQGED